REDAEATGRTLRGAPVCVSESPAANAITGWNVFVTAFRPLMKNITSTPTQTASGRPVIERTIGVRGGDSTATASPTPGADLAVRAISSAPKSGVAART